MSKRETGECNELDHIRNIYRLFLLIMRRMTTLLETMVYLIESG